MSRPDRPFGWRKRIGLLSPTVIETACHDFFRIAPDGVSMCATTSNIEHWNNENFQQARDRAAGDGCRNISPRATSITSCIAACRW